jgi:hypothetical protein
MRFMEVEGESGPLGLPLHRTLLAGNNGQSYWLPVAALLLLLAGYWAGIWYKGRTTTEASPRLATLAAQLGPALEKFRSSVASLLSRLNPTAHWRRLRLRMLAALPSAWRFWFCVRAVDQEKDPTRWCQSLQSAACYRPPPGAHLPLHEVVQRLSRPELKADPAKLQSLFQELDTALYGNKELDFSRWKKEFRRQVRPPLWSLGKAFLSRPYRRAQLPALNPSLA